MADGLWDTISSGIGSISKWIGDNSSTINTLANVGSAGFDIYSGIQAMNQADRAYDLMYGTAAKQDEWADVIKGRMQSTYWPYENIQYGYATEDLNALRPSTVAARDYNIERTNQQLAQARQINPLLDTTERNMLNTLTQSGDELARRYMSQATTDVNKAYGDAYQQGLRSYAKMGVNPNSGLMSDYARNMSQSQALALANARTTARNTAEDTALNRQAQALNYRAGIPLSTYNTTQSASAGDATAGLSGLTNTFGSAAQAANANAQQSFTGAASSIGNLQWQPLMNQYVNSMITKNTSGKS